MIWALCSWIFAFQIGVLAHPQSYEEITNPRLTSQEEVAGRIAEYEKLLAELSTVDGSQADTELTRRLLSRFLDFARSAPNNESVFVDGDLAIQVPRALGPQVRQQVLESIQDSFANMWKKWQTHIERDSPPGFIFVKLYTDREHMARDYQLGPDTAGVAFPCRYIAVVVPSQETPFWGQVTQYFVGEEFQQTVAHEFVHSLCFMTLGYSRAGALPRWFMEGFALHFSGARHVRTAIEGPGGVTIRDFDSSEEYQGFNQMFQFIQEKYGSALLYEFARKSLEHGSVEETLPQVLGLANEMALIGASVSWRRDRARYQQRLIVVGGVLVLIVFLLIRRRWGALRWVVVLFIVWAATVHASVSPYYTHTSLWWVPAALFLPLVYYAAHHLRRLPARHPSGIRLVVMSDWPRLDELMVPWPYDRVNLDEIAQSDIEFGWVWGEREIGGTDAQRLKEFLDSQPTNSFYFRGHAYRVWYERFGPVEELERGMGE